jgi:hypothetical protein
MIRPTPQQRAAGVAPEPVYNNIRRDCGKFDNRRAQV